MIDLPNLESDRAVDALLRQITWSRFAGDDGMAGPYRDDPASAAVVIELREAGERLAASGGLDALDERSEERRHGCRSRHEGPCRWGSTYRVPTRQAGSGAMPAGRTTLGIRSGTGWNRTKPGG